MAKTPVTPVIVYEYPLNEKVRIFLKLESLFQQIAYHIRDDSRYGTQAALRSILDIQELLGRNELKNELLKELERQINNLIRLQDNPDVDGKELETRLIKLQTISKNLYANSLPIGHELKDNEFLNSLRQRLTIPGGTCSFDMPGYHYWLNQPAKERAEQIINWLKPFDLLHQAIYQLLVQVRESNVPRKEKAPEGFFQKALDTSYPYQLLRISLPEDWQIYPEISGNRHRISIRFLQRETPDRKPVQTREDIEFMLTTCLL